MSAFAGKIKKSIPKINIQAMNLSMGHRLFLCFLVGVILGTFLLNVFLREYATRLGVYSEYFINGVNIYENQVDKNAFFLYCIKKYTGEFVIILLLNMMPINMWFNRMYCIYKGVVMALLISSVTLTYGAGGIVIYILSIFPHYILYIPFVIVSIYISLKVAELIKEHKISKFKIRAAILLVMLAVGTAFLEAYINYPIIKIAFSGTT